MTGDDVDLTCDAFLGGRLTLRQPRSGYRAGIDPVLLAASVPAKAGQRILDLGCGVGTAMFCLAARVSGLDLVGVERQGAYAALARQNAADNELPCSVVEADLAHLPAEVRQHQFDHVIANPPYFDPKRHSDATDAGRAVGRTGDTPLEEWVAVAARRLCPRGYLHVIQRSARLPELLVACAGRVGSLEVLPLAPRPSRAPDLVILRARKGGRSDFVLHAPLILHNGDRHVSDGDSYTAEIAQVLRHGATLPWPLPRWDRAYKPI